MAAHPSGIWNTVFPSEKASQQLFRSPESRQVWMGTDLGGPSFIEWDLEQVISVYPSQRLMKLIPRDPTKQTPSNPKERKKFPRFKAIVTYARFGKEIPPPILHSMKMFFLSLFEDPKDSVAAIMQIKDGHCIYLTLYPTTSLHQPNKKGKIIGCVVSMS